MPADSVARVNRGTIKRDSSVATANPAGRKDRADRTHSKVGWAHRALKRAPEGGRGRLGGPSGPAAGATPQAVSRTPAGLIQVITLDRDPRQLRPADRLRLAI